MGPFPTPIGVVSKPDVPVYRLLILSIESPLAFMVMEQL
jgi:hypothetical protein